MVIRSPISRIIKSPRWRATNTSAAIFPDATGAEGRLRRPRRAKRCRLLLEAYLHIPTADRDSRRREAYRPWAAPHFCSLALSREKPMSSSILHRCIGMLILPAADMSGLLRRRRSRLRRNLASKTTCPAIRG